MPPNRQDCEFVRHGNTTRQRGGPRFKCIIVEVTGHTRKTHTNTGSRSTARQQSSKSSGTPGHHKCNEREWERERKDKRERVGVDSRSAGTFYGTQRKKKNSRVAKQKGEGTTNRNNPRVEDVGRKSTDTGQEEAPGAARLRSPLGPSLRLAAGLPAAWFPRSHLTSPERKREHSYVCSLIVDML